jgi:hypothetical protein
MTAQVPYHAIRELYERMLDHDGLEVFRDILEPAIPGLRELLRPWERYRRRPAPEDIPEEDSWAFHALSVLNDYVRLPLLLNQREYLHFFQALGFQPFEGETFSPVRHELVEVSNWPRPEEGIQLGAVYWPGLMWGELVFSRAAVSVSCHPSFQILEGVADRSRLYFTNRRMRRDVVDLSHGWGSNSRWRTSFRFDYEEKDLIVFNLTGTDDLAAPERLGGPQDANADLTVAQRRELLMHRCFVAFQGDGKERMPWNDTLALRRTQAPWPLEEGLLVRRENL